MKNKKVEPKDRGLKPTNPKKETKKILDSYNFGFNEGYRSCQRDDVKNLNGYRVLKEHSENCSIIGTDKLFYLIKDSYYGNQIGNINKKKSNFHRWFRIICNDTSCHYQGIIEDNLFSKFIIKLDLKCL